MAVIFTGGSATGGGAIAPRFVEESDPPVPAPEVGVEGLGAASTYDIALSRVIAAQLTTDYRVQRFRAAHLGDHLLPWAEVEEWMRAHGPSPGEEPPWYVSLAVPPGTLWNAQAAVAAGEKGIITLEIPYADLMLRNPWPLSISYVVPGDPFTHKQPVKEGAGLYDLLTVVDFLKTSAPWTEAQTSVYMLTGLTPLIAPLRVETKVYSRLATLPRLVLELDARMSHRELVAAYQAARAVFAPDIRHRDMSEKHLELAVWSTLPQEREGTLAERMARWNAAHPQWAYRRTDNFSRDLSRAPRRLLRDLFPHLEDDDEHEREE